MKIYINNRADQLEEIPDDELVQAFWQSSEAESVLIGANLERCVLLFLARYGTFDYRDEGSGYGPLYDRILAAFPRKATQDG